MLAQTVSIGDIKEATVAFVYREMNDSKCVRIQEVD